MCRHFRRVAGFGKWTNYVKPWDAYAVGFPIVLASVMAMTPPTPTVCGLSRWFSHKVSWHSESDWVRFEALCWCRNWFRSSSSKRFRLVAVGRWSLAGLPKRPEGRDQLASGKITWKLDILIRLCQDNCSLIWLFVFGLPATSLVVC